MLQLLLFTSFPYYTHSYLSDEFSQERLFLKSFNDYKKLTYIVLFLISTPILLNCLNTFSINQVLLVSGS